ncbi:MAG: nucleotidyltransferase domain-containing protein [Oscillospiraceae bacterium]
MVGSADASDFSSAITVKFLMVTNMKSLDVRNQKIIEAVIEKADRVCPKSLAMIGIYGSFATGDFHEKSDLDLLVLINDDNGWQLGCTFIQDDLEIGHDIYCTTWEDLEEISLYNSPHISKLMDSQIVYCADEKYADKLKSLRKKTKNILLSPLSEEDFVKAVNMMKEAEHFYLSAVISEEMTDIRVQTGYTVYYIENAIAMLNKKYFRFGSKRIYEELELMENKPDKLCEMIESVLQADSAERIKESLTILMQKIMHIFKKMKATFAAEKKNVTPNSIGGTYEEMFSNWRNKMYFAAKENNRHLAFMSMVSFNAMISDICEKTDIGEYNVFKGYDPKNLEKTAAAFDDLINEYLQKEYRKANLQAERYKDIDSFVRQYLG